MNAVPKSLSARRSVPERDPAAIGIVTRQGGDSLWLAPSQGAERPEIEPGPSRQAGDRPMPALYTWHGDRSNADTHARQLRPASLHK